MVDQAVDGGHVLVVLVRLGLLHPKEDFHVGGVDLEDENPAGGALGHLLKGSIGGEEDEGLTRIKGTVRRSRRRKREREKRISPRQQLQSGDPSSRD